MTLFEGRTGRGESQQKGQSNLTIGRRFGLVLLSEETSYNERGTKQGLTLSGFGTSPDSETADRMIFMELWSPGMSWLLFCWLPFLYKWRPTRARQQDNDNKRLKPSLSSLFRWKGEALWRTKIQSRMADNNVWSRGLPGFIYRETFLALFLTNDTHTHTHRWQKMAPMFGRGQIERNTRQQNDYHRYRLVVSLAFGRLRSLGRRLVQLRPIPSSSSSWSLGRISCCRTISRNSISSRL